MSRFKRFTHSLLSGYMQLGVNSLFTIITVRLGLHYLSEEEYGLWIPTTVMAGYIALLDIGLSNSAARILIDYKDHQKPEEYGGLIQTSALVGLAQAVLILLVGTVLAFVMGPLLRIPAELEREFFWLVIGQCAVTAAMFATRIAGSLLVAHQRFDVGNYGGALSLVVNGVIMWWGFAHGVGVLSMMWGQAAGVVSTLAINWLACSRLGLFPREGQWGRPSWAKFHELFAFGRDIFLFQVGSQFVNLSQTLFLTRLVGLDAALTWGICTKAYTILVQVIVRIFDFSSSALAEMMVRDERALLLRRFREIAVLCVNLAVAAGVLLAIGNGPFVRFWTAGHIHWSPWDDLLLGIWLAVGLAVKVHVGLVGQTKEFRFLRYVYFIEGFAFIGLTMLFRRFEGFTLMLTLSILCSLSFTFPYGLWRTRAYFHLRWRDLAGWHRSTLALAAAVAPVAVMTWWFTRNLPALPQLMADSFLGIWTALMFLRYGLGASLRAEACRRAPFWARPILARAGFAK